MMKTYDSPICILQIFAVEDVITTSLVVDPFNPVLEDEIFID